MNAPERISPPASALADTHEVINVAHELVDFNAFEQDKALVEAVDREGAAWARPALDDFGRLTGSADYLELGVLANHNPPELDTHDRFGNRVDLVRFHPAYHQLMKTAIEHGLHASPWAAPRPGAHVARAAHCYLHTQVDAGHGCPVTMTFAVVPALRSTPELAALWEPKITARALRPAQRAGGPEGRADDRHGDDREAGRLRRARQHDARLPAGRAAGPARPTNSSATSTSSRRRCAMPSWCWRRRRAGCRASCCRAGGPTARRTRCRCCA